MSDIDERIDDIQRDLDRMGRTLARIEVRIEEDRERIEAIEKWALANGYSQHVKPTEPELAVYELTGLDIAVYKTLCPKHADPSKRQAHIRKSLCTVEPNAVCENCP